MDHRSYPVSSVFFDRFGADHMEEPSAMVQEQPDGSFRPVAAPQPPAQVRAAALIQNRLSEAELEVAEGATGLAQELELLKSGTLEEKARVLERTAMALEKVNHEWHKRNKELLPIETADNLSVVIN